MCTKSLFISILRHCDGTEDEKYTKYKLNFFFSSSHHSVQPNETVLDSFMAPKSFRFRFCSCAFELLPSFFLSCSLSIALFPFFSFHKLVCVSVFVCVNIFVVLNLAKLFAMIPLQYVRGVFDDGIKSVVINV